MKPEWVILLKFGEREHLEAFRERGVVYMNSQRYFAELESSDVERGDRFEGTDRIIQPADIGKLTIRNEVSGEELVLPAEDLADAVAISFGGTAHNLFCMFGVTKPIEPPTVDERNLAFGDSFILVLNTQAFMNRVTEAAAKRGLAVQFASVDYYDADSHTGETGVFRKPSTHAHQNEFRVAVSPGEEGPISLVVGSLADITTPVHPLADINRMLDFSPAAYDKARS